MIESHYHYTGSAVARRILDDWKAMLTKFIKVMPVEYKRALQQMAQDRKSSPVALEAYAC